MDFARDIGRAHSTEFERENRDVIERFGPVMRLRVCPRCYTVSAQRNKTLDPLIENVYI